MSGEADLRAEVGVATVTQLALSAGDCWIDCNPLQIKLPAADDACRLMAKHEGTLQHGIANARLLIPMQVRAADAHRPDLDERLTCSRFRRRLFSQS